VAIESRPPTQRARAVLAGPYAHPFYPILALVPIGAWIGSAGADLLSVAGASPETFARAAYWLLFIGIVAAVLVAMGCALNPMSVLNQTPATSIAVLHMVLNAGAVVVFAIGALIRQSDGLTSVSPAAFGISGLGLLMLGVSGRLGGKISCCSGVPVVQPAAPGRSG
jgi:uncharacterized membrane protein